MCYLSAVVHGLWPLVLSFKANTRYKHFICWYFLVNTYSSDLSTVARAVTNCMRSSTFDGCCRKLSWHSGWLYSDMICNLFRFLYFLLKCLVFKVFYYLLMYFYLFYFWYLFYFISFFVYSFLCELLSVCLCYVLNHIMCSKWMSILCEKGYSIWS